MTLDRQVERARRHMEEHRAKHGDPMLDGRKKVVIIGDGTPGPNARFVDENGKELPLVYVCKIGGVPVYTYPETLPWWRRFIAWWRG